jgi:hypothetical protein
MQEEIVQKKSWKSYFAFVKDKNFWKVLLLGQGKKRNTEKKKNFFYMN